MSRKHEKGMMVESREIAGIVIGIIVMAIVVSISYFLGSTGMFALGSGGVIMGPSAWRYTGLRILCHKQKAQV